MEQRSPQMLSRSGSCRRPAAAGEFRDGEASAGGGMVTVKMNGKNRSGTTHLSRVLPNKDQRCAGLVRAAVNEASRRVDEDSANQIKPRWRNPGTRG